MKFYKILPIIILFLFNNFSLAKPSSPSDTAYINIFIPTVFNPEKGKFCVLKSDSIIYQKFEMKISNRWGELLFETNDIKTCWDGNYKKQKLDYDAYVYAIVIYYTDPLFPDKLSQAKYNGTVILIR